MLEMMLHAGKRNAGFKFGNVEQGYYGLVQPEDFISGSSLATAIGLTGGTVANNTEGWLKFSYYGKTLYIAKKPFRTNVTWADIYTAGAVYGNNSYGRVYSGGASKLQNTTVVIGGKTYRVRLIKSAATDPTATTVAASELGDLVKRINSSAGGIWPTFNSTELGFAGGPGSFTWLVETRTSNLNARLHCYGPTMGMTQDLATTRDTYYGWRPVLELIP